MDADRAWAAQFVEAAGQARVSRRFRECGDQLSRILRAVVVHHRLPCPTGRTFFEHWLAATESDASLAERLAVDPFMPDLLFRYLTSGHCGDTPELPDAVAELCKAGPPPLPRCPAGSPLVRRLSYRLSCLTTAAQVCC